MKMICDIGRSVVLFSMVCLTVGCTASTDSPEVTLERANIFADRNRYEDAIPVYTKALEAFPDRPEVYYKRGVCYENLKLYEKALEDYTKCLELDPADSDAINNKGVVLAKLDRYEEAVREFSLLVSQFPDNVLALRNRGLCLHDLARFEDAIADYDRAIQLAPDDPQNWFQRGNVCLDQDRMPEAVGNFNKAIELDANFARAWMNRGVAKYSLGLKNEAMEDLRHARGLDDNIVIPGIDWADAAPALDVVVAAKPVLLAGAAADWSACEAFAKHEMLEKGFTEVTLINAYPDQRCGLFEATKDDVTREIYVGVRATHAASSKVSLPALSENPESRSRSLLILEFRSPADETEPVLSVADFVDSWTPATETLSPLVIQVKLESQ